MAQVLTPSLSYRAGGKPQLGEAVWREGSGGFTPPLGLVRLQPLQRTLSLPTCRMGTVVPTLLGATWLKGWPHEVLHGKCFASSKEYYLYWENLLGSCPPYPASGRCLSRSPGVDVPSDQGSKNTGGHHSSTPTLPPCTVQSLTQGKGHPVPHAACFSTQSQPRLFCLAPKLKAYYLSYNVNCPHPGLPSTGLHDLNTDCLCISPLC